MGSFLEEKMAFETNTHFTLESWNHPCFSKDYHMIFGPYPISRLEEIKRTIVKNFDPRVKYLFYKYKES